MNVRKKSRDNRFIFVFICILICIGMIPMSAMALTDDDIDESASSQFVTVEQLKLFNTNDETGKNSAKVYFGNNNQKWWIVGSEDDNLVLFAAGGISRGTFARYSPRKQYDSAWNCEYETVPVDVYGNHYGGSILRKTLQELETSYFTSAEQNLMSDTTVYTHDLKNNSVYSTTDKLYIPYGKIAEGYDNKYDYITVGANSSENLDEGLRIYSAYWQALQPMQKFWLREPYDNGRQAYYDILVAFKKENDPSNTDYIASDSNISINPAFELKTSSISFASSAPAVSSDGKLAMNDAMTLRYTADNLGFAEVSPDKTKVYLKNVPKGTYLVVQNGEGAWAKVITNEISVSAGDMGIDTFDKCEVWLETTDDAERMTYAAMATYKDEYIVSYVFKNKSDETMLPEEVNKLLPDEKRYKPGTNVKAEMLAVTEVKVSNGVWKFLGWNEESVDNIAEDIAFTGQWEFNPDTESDRDTSVNVDENDIPKTGDQINIGIYLLIIILSGFFSALGVAIKKINYWK